MTRTRKDGRGPAELRPVTLTRGYTRYAEGSVLITAGATWVLCTASVEQGVPGFLKGSGRGWLTAEYDMLPRATAERTTRAATQGRLGGRAQEIRRLIGRSLRAVVRLQALGERTIVVDCDVLQADGGTRTAAITGGFVALVDALAVLGEKAGWKTLPLDDWAAAVSVGVVDGAPRLDLTHAEDARADVDMNVVGTGSRDLIEVQGTAEGNPFPRRTLDALADLAERGIVALVERQRAALGDLAARVGVSPEEPGSVAAGTGEGNGPDG